MMTYEQWMRYTSQSGQRRSPKLKALDSAFENFEKNPTGPYFGPLSQALSEWAVFKGLAPDGTIRTGRSSGTVNQLINEVFRLAGGVFGPWLERDMALAQQVCDPFLTERVIGQGLSNSDEDRAKYKAGSGQSAVAMIGEAAKAPREAQKTRFAEHNIKPSAALAARGGGAPIPMYDSLDFWYKKGEREAAGAVNSGLWCDASAALIVYQLARNPAFKSRLDVVSQGDPKHFGHWYVVANRSQQDLLLFGYQFGANDQDELNFTIDIWGAIAGNYESSVIHPAQAIYDCDHRTGAGYDNNDIEVRCTIPRKLM